MEQLARSALASPPDFGVAQNPRYVKKMRFIRIPFKLPDANTPQNEVLEMSSFGLLAVRADLKRAIRELSCSRRRGVAGPAAH